MVWQRIIGTKPVFGLFTPFSIVKAIDISGDAGAGGKSAAIFEERQIAKRQSATFCTLGFFAVLPTPQRNRR